MRGELAAKGDPAEVLAKYNRPHCQQDPRARKFTRASPLTLHAARRRTGPHPQSANAGPAGSRHGLDERRNGVSPHHRRFDAPVDDPVVGIMIRTRIGMEVYGTNTELENLKVGPCAAGERGVLRSLPLRPMPAGIHPHRRLARSGWSLARLAGRRHRLFGQDSRYTAGVANLRATATFCRG